MKFYPTFYEKSFKKGTVKPKIEKKVCYPFLLSLFRFLQGKKSQISVQVASGDHIVLISIIDDICFSL